MSERVTIELDTETVEAARAANIDLAELLVTALRRRLPTLHASDRQQAAHQWYQENKKAVDSYNEFVERNGLFSDGVRTF